MKSASGSPASEYVPAAHGMHFEEAAINSDCPMRSDDSVNSQRFGKLEPVPSPVA